MRTLTKPDMLESQLVIGVVKQINWSEGKSSVFIEDEDGDLHEVNVHTKLIQSIDTRGLEGAKVICGTRNAQTFDIGPSFFDTFEVLHILDGSLAGQTLTYKYSS